MHPLVLPVPAPRDVLHEVRAALSQTLEHPAGVALKEVAFGEVRRLVEGRVGVMDAVEVV